jgi:hypothetical protein
LSRLETVLRTLPEAVDWPEPSPHLGARVTAVNRSADSPRRRPLWGWAVPILAAVVLVAGLIPGTRQAMADLLHEAGVRIGFVSGTPSLDVDTLDLGRRVDLEEAEELVEFDLAYPSTLAGPDATFIAPDLQVAMVWAEEGVLLIQGREGDLYAEKGLSPDTDVVPVSVGDQTGLWIEGADHTFTLLDPEGNRLEETSRLAGNVLLWNSDGVDYRLELGDGIDRALEIATSLERRP